MDQVAQAADAQITTDGAGFRLIRHGLTHQAPHGGDRIGPFEGDGDNRPQSQDSRFFGPIERSSIIGRAWLRYFPLDRIGFMEKPVYPGLDETDAGAGWHWSHADTGYWRGGSMATIQASASRS